MKRLAVFVLLIGLIGGLSGFTPASAAKPKCQVVATVQPRSCSFVSTGYQVSPVIVGTGNVSIYDSLGLRYAIYCPLAGARCFGKTIRAVAPGDLVVLTVNIGFGRVQSGALL